MDVKNKDFKTHYIRVAGIFALFGNAVLAITKIILGYTSSSMAVVGDGIDSSTDVLIAIVTLFVSTIVSQPGDKQHPWGHGRAETVATMLLAFIIFYAGSQLFFTSISRIISREYSAEISKIAIIASLISIAGKALLAASQFFFGKLADSEMVKANALNMKSDIILSAGVLTGTTVSSLFKSPVLDPIVAALVGLWVIKNSLSLFSQMNLELMDGNADSSLYKKLFDAATSVKGVENPHRARIRKMAGSYDIDLDVEVDPELSIYEAHELSELVEEAIRKELPEVYAVMIHVEPKDSCLHQREEEFGLNPKHLENETEK